MLSILLHILYGAGILILLFLCFRQKKALNKYTEGKSKSINDKAVEAKLKEAFASLHIPINKEAGEEDTLLHVKYQNAHFVVNFKNAAQQGIDLIYPFFYKEKIDYVDAIRSFCNRVNSYHSPIVASYITSDDNMYINASTNISALLSVKQMAEEFVMRASTFFSYQREITADLIEEIRKVKRFEIFDLEYNACCDNKMKQLLLESTLNTEKEEFVLPDKFLEERNSVTIGDLLECLHFAHPSSLTRMEVITGHSIFKCQLPEKINSYKLSHALFGGEHHETDASEFTHHEAVIKVYFKEQLNPEVDLSETERIVYLMLEATESTPQVLYYKVTICQPDKKLGNTPLLSLQESLHDLPAITLLLGYELITPNQQRAEFDFMYKDIDDKIAEGHTNELSPEQLLIFGITNPDAAFFAYWGKRFVRQGRYFEAFVRFEQAWKILNNDFDSLKKNEKKSFYEISALIGLCLYKLNLPKTALFYYHLASETENTYYFGMLIKCMIAANDPSCLKHIDNSLSETMNQIAEFHEDEEEVPETLARLYHFLRRSKVQICLRRNLLDTAEELCQELAKENENSDFALTYLEIIRQQRENL